MSKIVGLSYIAIMVWVSIGEVGETYGIDPYTVQWTFPLQMFSLVAIPFIAGYLAGKEDWK